MGQIWSRLPDGTIRWGTRGLEGSWSGSGAARERPPSVPGALRDAPERSKGAPERLGDESGSVLEAKSVTKGVFSDVFSNIPL